VARAADARRQADVTGHDLILVGGGLANGLIALRVKAARPHARVLLVEPGPGLGGNHTWSFYDSDLDAGQRAWLAPLVVHRWPFHDVRFPAASRRLGMGYNSLTSARFDAVVRAAVGEAGWLRAAAASVEPHAVVLSDGRRLSAPAVIDGRGAGPSRHLALGYQKFVGQELRLAAPHGLAMRVVMDATVAQTDGYRFVYLLPFAPDRVLVEDTRYSDGPELAPPVLREAIAAYAAGQGWRPVETLREETGVPVLLDAAAAFDAAHEASLPTVVSLHATKALGIGEGGFVASRDPAVIADIRRRSNFGFDGSRDASLAGCNGKLSEYGAALGMAALDTWPLQRLQLQAVLAYYRAALSDVAGVRIADGLGEIWVCSTLNIEAPEPVILEAERQLAHAGIATRRWWGRGLQGHQAFRGLPRATLANSEALAARTLGLPCWPGLETEAVDEVVGIVRRVSRS